MKFKNISSWCMALLCALSMQAVTLRTFAQNATITIDGNFNDWKDATEQPQTISSGDFKAISAFQDNEAVYIHIAAKENWGNLQGVSLAISDTNAKQHTFNFAGKDGDPFLLAIKDANYANVNDASINGSLQENARHWEIKLAKHTIGEVAKISFQNTEISSIPSLIQTPTPPEIPTEPEKPVEPVEPDGDGPEGTDIEIDGYFNDWKNLNHMNISWQNQVIAKACAVFDDDDSLCVHVGAKYRADRHLNLDNIRISINDGPATQIKLRQVNKNGSISSEPLSNIKQNHQYEMVAIIERDGKKYELGDAYYSTKMAKDREDFEFCIDLEDLEEALGLPEDSITAGSKIEITFPSIGDGNLILEGTSSGPLIGIGLCAGVVGLGFYTNNKKEKKNAKLKE